jgi:hypothetical protein
MVKYQKNNTKISKKRITLKKRKISNRQKIILNGGMKLNLNIFENHKIYSIEIETSDTVDAIMRIINDKEGIPFENQRLIFNGKMLEEGRTLADYGIEKDNTILVNLRHKNKI